MSDDERSRPVIAQIGGLRIVKGDSWWGGEGGAWAVCIGLILLALTWLAGVAVLIWAVAA